LPQAVVLAEVDPMLVEDHNVLVVMEVVVKDLVQLMVELV
jgi:hypothetical protein